MCIPFDFSVETSVNLPADTDVVFHLAANTISATSLEENNEVSAAQALLAATRKVSAKFIFISSQTANPTAPTAYGRIKWRIEQEALSAGGWVVRPGQVYGGSLRGLFGMLVNTVRRLPILPAFVPAPKIQPIHVDDLVTGLLNIAERGDVSPGVYCLGASVPLSFSAFLGEIARSRLRCRRGFFPVSVALINAFISLLGESLRTKLGLGRLSSLFNLPVMETASDLKKLGLVLRSLHSGMHPSGNDRRRCLFLEGKALLSYVLKESPGNAVLRRYVRSIEQLRGGYSMDLPGLFLAAPSFMSLLGKSAWEDELACAEFNWRLDTATILAEATPSGASRYLGLGRASGMLSALISISRAALFEIFWRLLAILFLPIVRIKLRRIWKAK